MQFGFIVGTLIFAFFAIADRYSPRKVFFLCSLAGAPANRVRWRRGRSPLTRRFLTGFFLAGIYPVGMKIASGWYERGLGLALGCWSGRWCSAPRSPI